MDIEDIKKNGGFYINETKPRIKDIALLSLRLSLKAYFSTYKSVSSYISVLNDSKTPIHEKNHRYSNAYIENATEAISHFQHFIELVIKGILRNKHELLTIDAGKYHTVLFDLLTNKKVSEENINKSKQIEFSEALNRLIELIQTDRISKETYGFIKNARHWIDGINYLRNRIAHRGVYIVRIDSLDFLFGKYIFPFIKEISSLEGYANIGKWGYQNNKLDINPIEKIIEHFNGSSYSMTKVALLKEIGRASYSNPIRKIDYFNHNSTEIRQAELISKHIAKEQFIFEVKICPICGTKSLIKYQVIEDYPQSEDDDFSNSVAYIYNAKCFCCSFELYHSLTDLENIENLKV